MNKDPVFMTITFYWLSILFAMFGVFVVFYVLAVIGYIMYLPVKIYHNIKRVYDERRVRS